MFPKNQISIEIPDSSLIVAVANRSKVKTGL